MALSLTDDSRLMNAFSRVWVHGLVCIALVPSVASSSAWFVQPSATSNVTQDDNIRLSNSDSDEVTGSVTSVGADLSYESEVTGIVIKPSLTVHRYSDGDDLDKELYNLNSEFNHSRERDQFSVGLGLSRDSTLTSEVDATGPTTNTVYRDDRRFSPSYKYRITERASIGMNYSYQQVEYEDNLNSGFIDYDYSTISGNVGYRITEFSDIGVEVLRRNYESRDSLRKTVTSGVSVGLSHQLSDVTTVRGAFGANTTDSKKYLLLGALPQEVKDDGVAFDLSIISRLEGGDIEFGFGRQQIATGAGDVREQDALRIRISHNFSERLSGSVNARAFEINEIGTGDDGSERSYRDIGGTLAYQFSRDWSLNGGYKYRWQKYSGQTQDAESNAVEIGVSYRPEKRPL